MDSLLLQALSFPVSAHGPFQLPPTTSWAGWASGPLLVALPTLRSVLPGLPTQPVGILLDGDSQKF